ncbi:MAG: 2-C-methyl-D-erythritol 4-phosphate cytidylyltransferase [Dehalococcoidia bacterium]|nr:2-C-methyl-D-erythritol 4-phosphate cytidylyltransferase [Dehalococcoidia bacterium]
MEGVDKLLADVHGAPLLDRTVQFFQESSLVDDIVLVLRPELVLEWRDRAKRHGWSKITAVVGGGTRRQDSVAAGLSSLARCDWVMIHDGARPCVTEGILLRGLEAAEETGAAIAAVPAKDTVKLVRDDLVVESTPIREAVWLVQTPQIFAFDIISKAYQTSDHDVTDDASLVEQAGFKVKVFMGAYTNIKVTTPDDLELVETFLRGSGH